MMLADLFPVLQRKYNSLKSIDPEARGLFVKRWLLSVLFHPLFLVLAVCLRIGLRILKPVVHIRFGRLWSYSVGGFSLPTEVYLCQRDAGMQPRHCRDIFYHYNHIWDMLKPNIRQEALISNQQLDRMFRPKLRLWEGARYLDKLNRMLPRGSGDFIVEMPNSHDQYGLLHRFPLHVGFTKAEEDRGFAILRDIGINPDSPFVCFHAWDLAYTRSRILGYLTQYRDGREASIDNYLLAAEKLAGLGYYAIRMGKYVEHPIHSDNPRIIDYASQFRSDFMDVFLSAHCAFFIGQNSGITMLPMMFRRPIAFVNMFQFSEISNCALKNAIFIPKKYYSAKKGRLLTFREILSDRVLATFHAKTSYPPEICDRIGPEIQENTPEEIAGLALEMDQRLRGVFKPSEEDEELQSRFLSIVRSRLDIISPTENHQHLRIGRHFLRTHPELLD